MIECKADCFIDDCHGCIRPIDSPTKLVWDYYQVPGELPGTLEVRKYEQCQCGCNKLIANPAINK